MQYALLEKLAADGNISVTDKDRIYSTCGDILAKVAFKIPFGRNRPHTWGEAFKEYGGEAFKDQAKILTRLLLPFGLVGGGVYAAKQVNMNVASNKDAKKIMQVKAELLRKPEFALDLAKAEARFDELVKISPKAASKAALAERMVRDRLHSGFTTEDVQRLSQIQATHEKGILAAVSDADKVYKAFSKISSADTGRIAATVVKIISETGLNKTAAWRRSSFEKATNIAKQVLTTGAIVSGFGAVVGLGAGAVNQGVASIKEQKRKERLRNSFLEAMKRSDPGKEPLHANREKALQAFQTLTHFAPNVAADPEAARAFMLSLISMDQGVQVGAIKDLSEIEKNLKTTKGTNPFFEGFGAGAEAVGAQKAIGAATSGLLNPFVEHGSSEIKREMGY